jgi:hypothetical protein
MGRAPSYIPTTAYIVGTLISVESDTVTLDLTGQASTATIPVSAIRTIDVSRGKKQNKVERVAFRGLVIGALVGGLIGGLADELEKEMIHREAKVNRNHTAVGVAAGSLVGLIIGVSAGVKSSGDVWQRVPVNEFRMGLLLGDKREVTLLLSAPI